MRCIGRTCRTDTARKWLRSWVTLTSRGCYVTVLKGTWHAGTGTVFDVKQAVPMPPGSFMVHPARAPHWDGSATDETVIVQITGYGPGTTTPVDSRQPLWVEVSR